MHATERELPRAREIPVIRLQLIMCSENRDCQRTHTGNDLHRRPAPSAPERCIREMSARLCARSRDTGGTIRWAHDVQCDCAAHRADRFVGFAGEHEEAPSGWTCLGPWPAGTARTRSLSTASENWFWPTFRDGSTPRRVTGPLPTTCESHRSVTFRRATWPHAITRRH